MKKGYKILILALLIAVIIFAGKIIYQKYVGLHLEPHEIEKYHFTIAYPKTYETFQRKDLYIEDAADQITVEVSGESVADYMASINMSENVLDVKDTRLGTRLLVDAIQTPKTNLDMEEICKRYAVMFKIYNEDLVILEKENELVQVAGEEAGKVTLTVQGENENVKVIAYLFSLEDREITVTFMTSESKFGKVSPEIERIVKSISFSS